MKSKLESAKLSRRDFLRTSAVAAAAAGIGAPLARGAEEGKPLVVAVVGAAHIHTPQYVDILKGRKDVKVKCVWDHDKARAEKRARPFEAKVVADPKEVWNDPDIAAVVICSETNRHRDLVLEAAAARKHLFVEKPLGFTAKESYEMADAVEKAGLLFTTGYFMRTMPPHLFLKEQVANGAFGKITRARGSNCHNGSLGGWFDTEWRWMADPKQAGVGAFGDLGTHSLDILMWLFGEVDSVTAEIKVVTGRYGECDESGEALIKFKNGVAATLAAGWVDIDNPVPLLISGTEGHAYMVKKDLYFKTRKVEGASGEDPWSKFPAAPPAPLNQFLDAVGGKPGQPLVTVREAARRVAVMEAMYKAARTQTWVKPA